MAEINLNHFEQLDDGNNNFMDETEYEKKKRKEKKIIDGIVAEINGCNLSVQSIIRNGNVEEDIEEQNFHLLETKRKLAELKRRLTALDPDHEMANPIIAVYKSRPMSASMDSAKRASLVSFSIRKEADRARKLKRNKMKKKNQVYYYKPKKQQRPQSATAFNRIKLRLPKTSSCNFSFSYGKNNAKKNDKSSTIITITSTS